MFTLQKFALTIAPALLAPALCAQESAEPMEAESSPVAAETGEILSVHCSGIDAWLRSPKDQAFLSALKMLGERLSELPAEFGKEDDLPPGLLPVLNRLCYGAKSLRIGTTDEDPGTPLPFYLQIELEDEAGQRPLSELLSELFEQVGMPLPEPDQEGRIALPLPLPIPVWISNRDGVFELELGSVPARAGEESRSPLPGGAELAFRAHMDYGLLFQSIAPLMDSQQDRAEFFEELQRIGLGDVELDVSFGTDEQRGYEFWVFKNGAKTLTAEFVSGKPITTEALNRVPADAEWAMLGSWDFSSLLAFYGGEASEALDPSGEFPYLFAALLELDDFELERDLTRYMGTTQGAYSSRGAGGGLFSTVAFVSLTDEQAFANSLAKMEAGFNKLAASQARSYLRLQQSEVDGIRMTSLQFPGLPIPLELTYGLADGYLVLGLSYRAVEAAFAHARSHGPGLLEAPGFLEQSGGDPSGALSIVYFDTPGLLADGYALADGVATLLANTIRTRTDVEGLPRLPGRLLPSYAALRKDALPLVSINWIEGADILTEMRFDPSMLVNATAMAPYFSQAYGMIILLGALTAGIEAPAQSAALNAERELALADIAEIQNALDRFAIQHAGNYPQTIKQLVRPNRAGQQLLDRERLPRDPWGTPYHYDPPTETAPKPRVYSLGEDDRVGGEGPDFDIDLDAIFPTPKSPLLKLLEQFL